MQTIKGQILASTEVDAQGEQRDRQFLEDLAAALPLRMPLHQHHDMGQPTVGFIENFRVEQDGEGWALKGDVTFDGPAPAEGGFSFSTTQVVHRAEGQPRFALYVPYPFYRDNDLLNALATNNKDAQVGRWIKKSADALLISEIALVISTLNLLVGPLWKKVYDEELHPRLSELVKSARHALLKGDVSRRLRVDYLQPVHIDAYRGPVELYFIPSEHADLDIAYGFAVKEAIERGMTIVQGDWDMTHEPIKRIVFVFEPDACRYNALQIIYANGTTRIP